MKPRIVAVVLMILSITGCNGLISTPLSSPPVTAISPAPTRPISTPSVTSYLQPTIEASSPPLTQTPTLLPTSPNLTEECPTVGNEISLDVVANGGTVVISPRDAPLYLLDLQSGEQYNLPLMSNDSTISGIEASPDRNWLAYREIVESPTGTISQQLWVITAKGQVEATVNFEENWYWWRWLNSESIEIYVSDTLLGTVVVLNPFSGERRELAPSFPDIYNFIDQPSWTVMYSPDLELVVYLSNPSPDQPSGVVIWDILSQRVLWQLAAPFTSSHPPAWSPLGHQVAAIVGGDLFLINRNGQVVTLPSLEELDSIEEFNWSPNGRFIAFWAGSSSNR